MISKSNDQDGPKIVVFVWFCYIMMLLKDNIGELKLSSDWFPYLRVGEIASNYTSNNLVLPQLLQDVFSIETKHYNDFVDIELNKGINEVLQAHKISFKYIWTYLLSQTENNASSKDLDYSIEKYIDHSDCSDNEEEKGKQDLKFGNYLDHWTFIDDSVNYFVPVVGENKIQFTQSEIDVVNKALVFGDVFPDNYDKKRQIWIQEEDSKTRNAEVKAFELFYDVYKTDSTLKSTIWRSKKRDIKSF